MGLGEKVMPGVINEKVCEEDSDCELFFSYCEDEKAVSENRGRTIAAEKYKDVLLGIVNKALYENNEKELLKEKIIEKYETFIKDERFKKYFKRKKRIKFFFKKKIKEFFSFFELSCLLKNF